MSRLVPARRDASFVVGGPDHDGQSSVSGSRSDVSVPVSVGPGERLCIWCRKALDRECGSRQGADFDCPDVSLYSDRGARLIDGR